jgi:hypothetical protein
MGAPNASWTEWTPFPMTPFPIHPGVLISDIAAAPLDDGRLQLWATIGINFGGISSYIELGMGNLCCCQKQTTDSHSSWTEWTSFKPATLADGITVARGSDGRLQLWVTRINQYELPDHKIQTERQLCSCFQLSTNPKFGWTEWYVELSGKLP